MDAYSFLPPCEQEQVGSIVFGMHIMGVTGKMDYTVR